MGLTPYTITDTTLRIVRADLVAAIQKAGATWPGWVELRDDEVLLTQTE